VSYVNNLRYDIIQFLTVGFQFEPDRRGSPHLPGICRSECRWVYRRM